MSLDLSSNEAEIDWVQAVVLFTQSDGVSGELLDNAVLLGGAMLSDFTEVEQHRVQQYTSDILQYLFERLGDLPGLRIVAIDKEQIRRAERDPLGACLSTPPDYFGIGQQQEPLGYMLATYLATIWWGHGCRVEGPYSQEIELGICTAMGLAWSRHIEGKGRLDHVLRILNADASTSGGNRLRAARGLPRFDLTAALALAIDDMALAGEGAVYFDLGDIARTYWGEIVGQDTILRLLEEIGIAVPNPFG